MISRGIEPWTAAEEIAFMRRLAQRDWGQFRRITRLINVRRWDRNIDPAELHRGVALIEQEYSRP